MERHELITRLEGMIAEAEDHAGQGYTLKRLRIAKALNWPDDSDCDTSTLALSAKIDGEAAYKLLTLRAALKAVAGPKVFRNLNEGITDTAPKDDVSGVRYKLS